MAVVINEDLIEEYKFFVWLKHITKTENTNETIIMIGVFVLIVYWLGLIIRAYYFKIQTEFVQHTEARLVIRIFNKFLRSEYEKILQINKTEFAKDVLVEVKEYVNNIIAPVVTLITSTIFIILIFMLLLIVEPMLTLFASIIFISGYLVIGVSTKNLIKNSGSERFHIDAARYALINSGTRGIKEIKINRQENQFSERCENYSLRYANAISAAYKAQQLPRYLLEGLAFGAILLIVIWLRFEGGGSEEIIPSLSLLAFAGYKMMPVLQQIYNSIGQIRFGYNNAAAIHLRLNEDEKSQVISTTDDSKRLEIGDELYIKRLKYTYPNSEEPAIDVKNLKIVFDKVIGIYGHSGSGRSTFADLFSGLLIPESCEIEVNGTHCKTPLAALLQDLIAYAPQKTYIFNGTVLENITGSQERLLEAKKSAKLACIDQYISELRNNYSAFIGEDGETLSGGQAQRIGLARALVLKKPI